MPHRRIPECRIRHRYRTHDHMTGCSSDTWPHYHCICRRCYFEFWQPTLWSSDVMAHLLP